MRACIVLVLLVGLTLAADNYRAQFTDADLDTVLGNARLVRLYVNCLLDVGKCPPDAAKLKKILPDALKTECRRCDAKQKAAAYKVINYFITKRNDDWKKLQKKYDPTNEYQKRFDSRHAVKNA